MKYTDTEPAEVWRILVYFCIILWTTIYKAFETGALVWLLTLPALILTLAAAFRIQERFRSWKKYRTTLATLATLAHIFEKIKIKRNLKDPGPPANPDTVDSFFYALMCRQPVPWTEPTPDQLEALKKHFEDEHTGPGRIFNKIKIWSCSERGGLHFTEEQKNTFKREHEGEWVPNYGKCFEGPQHPEQFLDNPDIEPEKQKEYFDALAAGKCRFKALAWYVWPGENKTRFECQYHAKQTAELAVMSRVTLKIQLLDLEAYQAAGKDLPTCEYRMARDKQFNRPPGGLSETELDQLQTDLRNGS